MVITIPNTIILLSQYNLQYIISRNSLEFDPNLATIRDEKLEEVGNGASSSINDFDLDSVVIENQKLSHLTNNRARKPNQKQRRKPTKFAKK